MNYKTVELSRWSRGDLFQYYINSMRIVMSLTADVDVTGLLSVFKRQAFEVLPRYDLGRLKDRQCAR